MVVRWWATEEEEYYYRRFLADEEEDEEGGHGRNHDLVLMIMCVLVITGVLVLQNLARLLKAWSEGNKHAMEILEASERELSILGLVAFFLFVLQPAMGHSSVLEAFHEVHLALSTCAIFFVGVNLLLYHRSKLEGTRWRRLERNDVRSHRVTAATFRVLSERLGVGPLDRRGFGWTSTWTVFGKALLAPATYWRYRGCLEAMSFHEIRRDMLRAHRLPADFRFSSYLQLCMQHVCLEFTEIRDAVWVLAILVLVGHHFFSAVIARAPPFLVSSPETLMIWLSSVVVVLTLVVDYKIRYIYWYIMHSELLHDPDLAASASNDRQADPTTLRPPVQGRRRRTSSSSGGKGSGHSADIKDADALNDDTDDTDDDEDDENDDAPDQLSLFWFRNPGFLVTLLETCIFILSANVALLVFKVQHHQRAERELVPPVAALATAATTLFLHLPSIVPRFTLVTHVGQMSDPRRIAQVVRTQEQKQRASLGRADSLYAPSPRRRSAAYSVASITRRCAETLNAVHWIERFRKVSSDIYANVVEAPVICKLTSALIVADVFLVAIAVDEQGARGVLGSADGVFVVVALLDLWFFVEALLRWRFDPRQRLRQLDLAVASAALGAGVASFAVSSHTRDHRLLRALSGVVILRLLPATWRRHDGESRLEHLRYDAEKQLVEATPDVGSGENGLSSPKPASPKGGRRRGPAPRPSLSPRSSLGSSDDDQTRSRRGSDPLETMLREAPAWLQCYCTDVSALPPSHPQAAIERTAIAAVRAALREEHAGARDAAAMHAERTRRVLRAAAVMMEDDFGPPSPALSGVGQRPPPLRVEATPDDAGSCCGRKHPPARRPSVKLLDGLKVTASQDQELEAALYFNAVQAQCVVGAYVERRIEGARRPVRAASTSSIAHKTAPAASPWRRVRLVLTTDQLVYYKLSRHLSEYGPSGAVRHAPAATAAPTTLALDWHRGARRPNGRLHVATLLKIDMPLPDTLVCTTPSHVLHVRFDGGADEPDGDPAARWKALLERSVAGQGDDDPVHPMRRRGSANLKDKITPSVVRQLLREASCDSLNSTAHGENLAASHHGSGTASAASPQGRHGG